MKGKRLSCFCKSLITTAPLSVRVGSDVVEEVYLNCPKRSGRVRTLVLVLRVCDDYRLNYDGALRHIGQYMPAE